MDEKEKYRLKSFLDRSPNRKKILELLSEEEEALRPTDIAQELEVQRQTISSRITDLKEEGLVELLNPDDNRNRYYRVNKKGRDILD
jgi:DNA-binding transcriptional ArsR family regulator